MPEVKVKTLEFPIARKYNRFDILSTFSKQCLLLNATRLQLKASLPFCFRKNPLWRMTGLHESNFVDCFSVLVHSI